MELSRPFIKLPYRFDVAKLQEELSQFEEHHWMPHPSGMQGNSAIPLVSLNGQNNDDFAGSMQLTPHLQRCDYMRQTMASFEEVLARSRLMKLAAGNEVSLHVDFNYHWYSRVRIHIPIVTTPEVIFYCGSEQTHMQAGDCWIFDSWRRHRVVNNSPSDRVHLVIDTAGSSRFWQMVRRLENQTNEEVETKLVPYIEHKTVSIRTEQYNLPPIMAAGEMDAIVKELIADFSANPKNETNLVKLYRELLLDLAYDWRETSQLYGYSKKGWPIFHQLLQATTKRLLPDARALTTASNDLGVNPIIMQRIVRVALNVEQMPRYLSTVSS